MTDVLTPAKGLTQQTVGGNNNSWGTILNTTLGLIDSALGGTLAKSISGNATLSSTEAQNAGYHFTGTLSGTATITFPSFFGMAAIRNHTTGGYSITCGISGGASVSVLNGETVAILSDGTDFIRLSQVGGGGTLSRAYGGTGVAIETIYPFVTLPQGSTFSGNAYSNVTLGVGAGASAIANTGLDYLTAIGFEAAGSLTTADHVTCIGAWAGNALTTGVNSYILALGIDAMRAVVSATFVNALGNGSMENYEGGSYSVGVGDNTLMYGTNASRNIAIGFEAIQGISGTPLTGGDNIAIGYQAGNKFQGAANTNTVGGSYSFASLTTGTANTGWGYQSGLSATGSLNSLFGYQAGYGLTAGSNNTAVGVVALFSGTNGNNNTAVGYSALNAATGASNTALGFSAGKKIIGGGSNLVLGNNVASTTLTTGGNNVLIGTGSDIDTASSSTSNTIQIGAGSTAVISATGTGTPATSTTTIAGALSINGTNANVLYTGITYANRPGTPVAGMVCYFTDSTTVTWGATITGTGSNKVLGWYNGTNWTVFGA